MNNNKSRLEAMELYLRNGYGHISEVDGRSYDIARMSELVSNKDHDVTVVIFYGEGQPLEIIDFYYGEYDFFDTENVIAEYHRNKNEVPERKTQEDYYQELLDKIDTRKKYIDLLVNCVDSELSNMNTEERKAVKEFVVNWQKFFMENK